MNADEHPATPTGATASFAELGLRADLAEMLVGTHLEHPTALQCELLPPALEGKDCLVLVRSGAGKTNGFVLPITQKLQPNAGLQAVVITPTRSTALRVKRCFERFQEKLGFSVAVQAGGGQRAVRDPITEAPDVLIATPRCARDLMDEKSPGWFESVRTIVVDDADAILDLGDRESLDRVYEGLAHEHQRIMIAAEAGGDVDDLAEARLPDAHRIEFGEADRVLDQIKQVGIEVGRRDRGDVLIDFVKQDRPKLVIVFTADARAAEHIAMRLSRARVSCRTVGDARPPRGGELGRPDRHDRGGRGGSEVVVTHDPAPRRLSTIPASHVVHMELPRSAGDYARRLRQCDRLHRRGASIAFIADGDADVVTEIEQMIGQPLERITGPRPVDRPQKPHSDDRRRDDRPPPLRDNPSSSSHNEMPDPPAEPARPPAITPATDDNKQSPRRTLGSRLPVKRKKRLR